MNAKGNPSEVGLWLTVDQGNSSTKFVVWRRSEDELRVEERVTVSRAELATSELLPSLAASVFQGIALSTVASEADLATLLAHLGGEEGVHKPSCGLPLEVRHPETVGADRLFAARGAVELAGSADGVIVVVDAGTTLTVDCVRDGTFLGGAIAPGPALLSAALASGGAQLFNVAPDPTAPALGRESREALEAGVVVGFRGAAKELVRCQLEDEAVGTGLLHTVYLTGGARRFLLEPEPFVDGALVEAADLVHRGLLAALWSELGFGRV